MYQLYYEPFELLHQPVKEFQFNGEIDPHKLEAEMIAIMSANNGIGLAANQIGLDARIAVIGSHQITGFITPQAFINPVITNASETYKIDREGCLSFPGLWLNVRRPEWIEMSYQNPKGDVIEVRADGYLAKVLQHEIDHLHGICFTDRVGRVKLDMALKKMEKARRREQ